MQKTDVSMEEVILEAATRLFVAQGFAATSTTQIAREVGCNQALVHYYYRTKDRLFSAIFEKKARGFIRELIRISGEELPFEEKLKLRITSHFEMVREDPAIPLLLWTELRRNEERRNSFKAMIEDVNREALELFDAELKAEIEAGHVRSMSVHELILMMITLNVSVFMAQPLMQVLADLSDEEYERLIETRKAQNIEYILENIKPK